MLKMSRVTLTADSPGEPSTAHVRAALDWYHEIVGAVASANRDSRAWWYNWLSSRDCFNNNLAECLAHVLAADAAGSTVACTDFYTAEVIAERMAARHNIVERSLGSQLIWMRGRAVDAVKRL